MATDEELYRIILEVSGASEVSKLTKSVADAEQGLRDLLATQKAMGAGGASMSAMVKDQANALKGLQDQLKDARNSLNSMGSTASANAYKLQQLGQTLDDLQYVGEQGLRPILNNLMQFSPVIGIAALAFEQLYRHSDDIAKLWGGGHTKTEAERMKDLADQTEKTAAETAKLAKYERERKAIESQETTPTKAQSDQQKSVNEAITEATAPEVDSLIKKLHGKAIANTTPETMIAERAKQQSIIDNLDDRERKEGGLVGDDPHLRDVAKARRDSIDAAIQNRVDEWVRTFRGKIATDPQALKAFTEKAEADGSMPVFAKKLRDAQKTPEERAADDEETRYEAWRVAQEDDYQAKLAKSQVESDERGKAIGSRNIEAEAADAERGTQASIDRIHDQKRRDNAKARDIAGGILKGATADPFLAGTATDDDVSRELARRGERTDDPLLRDRVKRATEKQAQEMGAAQATEKGLNGTEEGRLSLVQEANQKREDERKKLADQAAGKITDKMPELPNLLKNALTGSVQMGGGLEEARDALKEKLMSRFGAETTNALLEGPSKAARGELLNDVMSQSKEAMNVQVLQGNTALKDSIQSAVKEPEWKLVAEKLDRVITILDDRLDNGGLA